MDLTKLNDNQYKTLKEYYQKAKEEGKNTFTIWEQNILTDYAKYLIQAIEQHRKNTGEKIIENKKYPQEHNCSDMNKYTWQSIKKNPVACPRCKKRLDIKCSPK